MNSTTGGNSRLAGKRREELRQRLRPPRPDRPQAEPDADRHPDQAGQHHQHHHPHQRDQPEHDGLAHIAPAAGRRTTNPTIFAKRPDQHRRPAPRARPHRPGATARARGCRAATGERQPQAAERTIAASPTASPSRAAAAGCAASAAAARDRRRSRRPSSRSGTSPTRRPAGGTATGRTPGSPASIATIA